MSDDNPIIIALDYPSAKQADEFLHRIEGHTCKLKVGLELFIAEGPKFVEKLSDAGHHVFLDLKLHDIPNTVASACKSASSLGVWMMTLHALGGQNMLEAARDAMSASHQSTKLVAVTVLTSMNEVQLSGIGIQHAPNEAVMTLSEIAMKSEMDGMVCSVHEVEGIRKQWGNKPLLVTPGIRMQNDASHDQSRIASPQKARAFGSNYIVVGRPITRADNPISAINQYLADWNSCNK